LAFSLHWPSAKTGKGCYVDTALVDSTVGVLSNQAMNYLVSGKVPKRIGNARQYRSYQVFPVADATYVATERQSVRQILQRPRRARARAKSNTRTM
jgi:crotonobetainyl-CoA:carnitine CoA-transferase CaiB-like acyl-CoA transferase